MNPNIPGSGNKSKKGSENLLTVKVIYTRLSDGSHGTTTKTWPGNLTGALAYFHPDSMIELDGEKIRVDLVYIWPGDLEEHEALKVWRQSRTGLGYSMTGIGGPYTAAAEGW